MSRRTRPPVPFLLMVSILASVHGLVGCSSSPDLAAWRAGVATARPSAERGVLGEELALVTSMRAALDLDGARKLALTLAAENPDDAATLTLASRSESDAVFLFPPDDRARRDQAAWSAFDLATQAIAKQDPDAADAEARAQLAYARGSTIHLQGMFSRAGGAREALEHAEAALTLDPENTTALATKSTIRLRLATLPWIAGALSIGEPEGSVEEAVALAERCVEQRPSVEHRILLARALLAAERSAEAQAILDAAITAPPRFPRDQVLRPQLTELRESFSVREQIRSEVRREE